MWLFCGKSPAAMRGCYQVWRRRLTVFILQDQETLCLYLEHKTLSLHLYVFISMSSSQSLHLNVFNLSTSGKKQTQCLDCARWALSAKEPSITAGLFPQKSQASRGSFRESRLTDLILQGSFRKTATQCCRALSAKMSSMTAGLFSQKSHTLLGSFAGNALQDQDSESASPHLITSTHCCRALFAKEPRIAGLICRKCPARSRQQVCVATVDNMKSTSVRFCVVDVIF